VSAAPICGVKMLNHIFAISGRTLKKRGEILVDVDAGRSTICEVIVQWIVTFASLMFLRMRS